MRSKMIGFLALAIVFLMGCSLLSPAKVAEVAQQIAPTAAALATQAESHVATAAPAATAQPPAETTASAPSGEIHGPMDEADLHSFRSTITVTLESKLVDPSPVTIYQVEITKAQKPQPVTHLVVKSGLPLKPETEIYETKGGFYSRDPESGQWITLQGEGFGDTVSGAADLILSPQAVLAMAFSKGKPVTYQGKPALQYHWEASTPQALQQAGLSDNLLPSTRGLGDARFEPQKVTVDAITLRNGLVVKQVMRAEGQLTRNGQTAPAVVTWQMTLTDLNADLNLPLPQDLQTQTSATNAPLPLPENAKLSMAMGGAGVYTVPNTTVDDLLAFWRDKGLTVVSKMGDAQGGMFVVVKKADGTQVKVLLGIEGQDVVVTFTP